MNSTAPLPSGCAAADRVPPPRHRQIPPVDSKQATGRRYVRASTRSGSSVPRRGARGGGGEHEGPDVERGAAADYGSKRSDNENVGLLAMSIHVQNTPVTWS
uniref:Uncharacterized protein n=1 Tax=Arundo donax TaxID=35708 RepID=A0A0A9DLP3_ARUDO